MEANLDQTIDTSSDRADSDAEGLEDGEEVGELVTRESTYYHDGEPRTFEFQFFEFNSHPLDFDTDNDMLNDSVEVNGWNVTVVNRSGEMYRWHTGERVSNGQLVNVTFTSNPMRGDTDGDGLTDYQEKERYHTDPESRVTYEITEEHQREIIGTFQHIRAENDCEDRYACSNSLPLREMGFITHDPSTMDTIDDLDGFQLTDRTDDFDFVVADEYTTRDEQWWRFAFRSIDTNNVPEETIYRTDTWLPNGAEIAGLDPWDPDTDDDGLTDGQERRGLTRIVSEQQIPNPAPFGANLDQAVDTSPTRTDSDGDGWWDGWIGVYDVGRSDNVILYNEHLHDDDDGDGDTDDGVQGSEIVQEQVGFHDVTATATGGGTDIDGDGNREHSNLHIGERHWGTDPWDDDDAPTESVSIEVDYYEGADQALDTNGWRQQIARNYRLYGIDLTVERGETIQPGQSDIIGADPPFSQEDLFAIEEFYHTDSDSYYLFVGSVADSDFSNGAEQGGAHRYQNSPIEEFDRYIVVLTEGLRNQGALNDVPNTTFGMSAGDVMRSAAAKTAVHEIGHIFRVGEIDDIGGDEIYSGRGHDPTQKIVADRRRTSTVDEWSVMSGGLEEDQYLQPTNNRYTPFSIEEVISLRTGPFS